LRCFERDTGVRTHQLQVTEARNRERLPDAVPADVMGRRCAGPKVLETTALGAAYLAGLATGFWKDRRQIAKNWQEDRYFEPAISEASAKSSIPAGCARSSARAAGGRGLKTRVIAHRGGVRGSAGEHAGGLRAGGGAGPQT